MVDQAPSRPCPVSCGHPKGSGEGSREHSTAAISPPHQRALEGCTTPSSIPPRPQLCLLPQHSLFFSFNPPQEESWSQSCPKQTESSRLQLAKQAAGEADAPRIVFTLNNSPSDEGNHFKPAELCVPGTTSTQHPSRERVLCGDTSPGVRSARCGGGPTFSPLVESSRSTMSMDQPQNASPDLPLPGPRVEASPSLGSFITVTASPVLTGGMEPSDAQAAHPSYVGTPGRDGGLSPSCTLPGDPRTPRALCPPPPRAASHGSRAGDRGAVRRDVPRPYGMVFLLQF